MAIYYLRCDRINRSKGSSMVSKSAYINGISLYDQRKKRTYSGYKYRSDVMAQFLLLPKGAPSKFYNRKALWNASEATQKGNKGYIGYEMIVSVPYELKASSASDLVEEFSAALVEHFKCAIDAVIHSAPQNSPYHDKRNVHAHILLSRRQIDKNGFKDELITLKRKNYSEQIKFIRKLWELCVNKALEKDGIKERVDCRSYKERGIDKIPQIHVGKRAKYMHLNGHIPESKKKRWSAY